jgi:hypothetical protein
MLLKLFEMVLAKRELVSEVMRVNSLEGMVETPVMLLSESKAGLERIKI